MCKAECRALLLIAALLLNACNADREALELAAKKPNFLIVVSDDQSWVHTSFAGYPALSTPAFDRIANNGVYFTNAYASAPTCTAARTSLLSGRHFWQTGPGATLWGSYVNELPNFQIILRDHGYQVGYTGKGWGPGKSLIDLPLPWGVPFNTMQLQAPKGISNIDYSANFATFLAQKPKDQAFAFLFTPFEPHRPYGNSDNPRKRVGRRDIKVPDFLPNSPTVKKDIANYLNEIEWFDRHLENMLQQLEQSGELENTLVIVTSDNGMPFPRAKSNNYEYGVHMPMAVMWKSGMKGGRQVTDFINLADIAPTLLEAAGIAVPAEMTGVSFLPLLHSGKNGRIDAARNFTVTGFERHVLSSRPAGMNYPIRALHTDDFVYIRNFFPERWPAGDPPTYSDIDNQSPTKLALLAASSKYEKRLRKLATGKRPAEELYFLPEDPFQLNNLARESKHHTKLTVLRKQLLDFLTVQNDQRVTGDGHEYDNLPYYGPDSVRGAGDD